MKILKKSDAKLTYVFDLGEGEFLLPASFAGKNITLRKKVQYGKTISAPFRVLRYLKDGMMMVRVQSPEMGKVGNKLVLKNHPTTVVIPKQDERTIEVVTFAGDPIIVLEDGMKFRCLEAKDVRIGSTLFIEETAAIEGCTIAASMIFLGQ